MIDFLLLFYLLLLEPIYNIRMKTEIKYLNKSTNKLQQ